MKDALIILFIFTLTFTGACLGNHTWIPAYPIGAIAGALCFKWFSKIF